LRFIALSLALVAAAGFAFPEQAGASFAATPVVQPLPVRPKVAIIDSGIARTAELQGSLVAEFDTAAVPARPAFHPHDAHGTMVATILLREATRPIDIISLRIDDPAGCPVGYNPPCQGRAEPVAAAIRKATELGVSVINISLAMKDDPAIVDAVRDAAACGIAVVLAAGNDGRAYPSNLKAARAAYPRAVLVGALDQDGAPWKGSNRPQVDTPGYRYVWRPGVAVPTVLADGSEVVATGTSFAAPIETARLLDRANALEPQLAGHSQVAR
jgi:hypothetical protein